GVVTGLAALRDAIAADRSAAWHAGRVALEPQLATAGRTAAVSAGGVAVVAVLQTHNHAVAAECGALAAHLAAIPARLQLTGLATTIPGHHVGVVALLGAAEPAVAAGDVQHARGARR